MFVLLLSSSSDVVGVGVPVRDAGLASAAAHRRRSEGHAVGSSARRAVVNASEGIVPSSELRAELLELGVPSLLARLASSPGRDEPADDLGGDDIVDDHALGHLDALGHGEPHRDALQERRHIFPSPGQHVLDQFGDQV